MHIKKQYCILRASGVVAFCLMLQSLMATENDTIFKSWDDVVKAPYSEYFHAGISDMKSPVNYVNKHPWLSEELLFIQSNTRIVVCQNPKGELRYVALPLQTYPVPTDMIIPNMPSYGPGMYYHFDVSEIQNISYSFKPEKSSDTLSLVNDKEFNRTYYANHFLPVTRCKTGDIESTLITFAPVSPEPNKGVLYPAPLPGPPGAFYLLHIKNTGNSVIKGSVLLTTGINSKNQQSHCKTERNTLIISSPGSTAGIQLVGGKWEQSKDNYIAAKEIELKPGESALIQSFVILGKEYNDIMPVVYQFFLKDALEWLNITADFWKKRLGSMAVSSGDFPDASEISRDIYYRCMIDNFCCIQTNTDGEILSHYQGVPKQGTIWGIDYEPTIISAMQIAPELGRAGILFTMNRNYAPRTKYGNEHSVPILISPVIIARKYLELTGDIDFFKNNHEIIEKLDHSMKDLVSLKSPDYTLFPSRYSSDGPVGRRYDHGTNVKVFYALQGYGLILDGLGEKERSSMYYKMADEVRKAIDKTMVIDGPFGRQISGGTNLGEDHGAFYLNDSVLYYDGEDTGSHLAQVYGVYGFDYQPWINYHRWERSIFCPSWEPEFGTVRWFPSWSMPVLDGTGWVSALGGSQTRSEMDRSLNNLYKICDPSAAFYWWPFGYNFKQGLSRCSQGQGTWAWQYLEQWLGIKINALTRTLTFCPLGLPDQIDWKNMSIGNNLFDIKWNENPDGANITVTNHNLETWTIKLGTRPYGTGAEGTVNWKSIVVMNGETSSLYSKNENPIVKSSKGSDIIAQTEVQHFGDESGVVFIRYGTVDPFPSWYHLWKDESLDLRFYILNGTDSDWEETKITLRYPDGWQAKGRKPGYWENPEGLKKNMTSIDLGNLGSMKSTVAPFMMKGKQIYDHDYLTKGLSIHFPAEYGPVLNLPAKEINAIINTSFEAVITAKTKKGEQIEKKLVVPVNIIPAKD